MPKRALARFLPRADQERVVQAIRAAERRTSGQIKIHLEERCPGDPMERAKALFLRLGLTATTQRNGVLLYLAFGDRKFAILGDQGIHGATGAHFWETAAAKLKVQFLRGSHAEGLVEAVAAVGERLAEHFPPLPGQKNELADDLSTE